MFKRLIATVLLFIPGAVCAGDTALEWLDRSHQAVGGEAWDEVSSVRIHPEYSIALISQNGIAWQDRYSVGNCSEAEQGENESRSVHVRPPCWLLGRAALLPER